MSSNFKIIYLLFNIIKTFKYQFICISPKPIIFPILVKFNHSLKYSSLGTTLEKDLVKLFETLK